MPIYEYQCSECRHQFDVIQKVDAPPLSDCPECELPSLVKLISAPSFRLKGDGWYETDFKKDNRRNLAGDSGGDDKSSADTATGEKSASNGEKKVDAAGSGESKSSSAAAGKSAGAKTGNTTPKTSGNPGTATGTE